nr:hypothetical protein [Tanacetum cinerariifolium]
MEVPVDYVLEPEYPKYLVPSDVEAPIEDQPIPDDASPTALSPGYVADSDPKEDPEEDLAKYPADEGDDDDDKEEEEDDEEKEEHLALSDSNALHIVDLVSPAEVTEAFETDKSAPTLPRSPRLHKTRISVQPKKPMAASAEALITEYANAPTPALPPRSPLTPLSSLLP